MSANSFSRHHIARFMIATLLSVGAGSLFAQGITYPTYAASTKANVKLNGSPAFAKGPDGVLWAAYNDANTGTLSVASSTNGVNFTVHQSRIGLNSDPAIATVGAHLIVAFVGNANIQTVDVTGGNFGPINYFYPSGTPYAVRPALQADANGYLYLAWQGRAYDAGNGSYDGQWIDAAYSVPNNFGQSFTQNGAAITQSYSALSGPALALRANGNLYLTYLDGANGNPHVFLASGNSSLAFTETSPTAGAGGHYAGDASIVDFNYLFPMFRSAFSSDNLWTIGTSDSYNYGPGHSYGQTLTFAPALAVANGNTLYQGGRSNYGNDLWVSSATYNGVNPF